MDASTSTLPILLAPKLRAPRGGLLVGDRHYRGGVFLPPAARPYLESAAAKAAMVARAEALVVGILGFSYRVEPIAVAPAIGSDGWSLFDLDRNRLHHVHRSASGEVVCDCGDFTFRRSGTGQPCKHGRRLIELGLIPGEVPMTLPSFARRGASAPTTTPPAPIRRRRFEPTPEDCREAALLFAGG